MRTQNKKGGFTLIELLVVITIIGILATGAVATYTSQIQKARDTTRINDLKTVQSGVEQYYQDQAAYPDNTVSAFSGILNYMDKLPTDTKDYQPGNVGGNASHSNCLGYVYMAGADANGITLGNYELSTGFEAKGNITGKAMTDALGSTNDLNRLEIGTVSTGIDFKTSCVGNAKSAADFAAGAVHIKTAPELGSRGSPAF